MTGQDFAGLAEIGQINVPVHDLDRAVDFYRDTLGIQFLFRVEKMAFFDCQGIRLVVGTPEGEAFDLPSSIIYFKVPDLPAATEALRGRGVKITKGAGLTARMSDHDLWMSFYKDLNGNALALMSEVLTD